MMTAGRIFIGILIWFCTGPIVGALLFNDAVLGAIAGFVFAVIALVFVIIIWQLATGIHDQLNRPDNRRST